MRSAAAARRADARRRRVTRLTNAPCWGWPRAPPTRRWPSNACRGPTVSPPPATTRRVCWGFCATPDETTWPTAFSKRRCADVLCDAALLLEAAERRGRGRPPGGRPCAPIRRRSPPARRHPARVAALWLRLGRPEDARRELARAAGEPDVRRLLLAARVELAAGEPGGAAALLALRRRRGARRRGDARAGAAVSAGRPRRRTLARLLGALAAALRSRRRCCRRPRRGVRSGRPQAGRRGRAGQPLPSAPTPGPGFSCPWPARAEALGDARGADAARAAGLKRCAGDEGPCTLLRR